jgi:ABC-2 type transport system permease protein
LSTAQIRLATLWRREVNRFMKIKKQTLGAPLLETFLYISVFGAALGSRVGELHGIDYVVFVIPGLIMMSFSSRSSRGRSRISSPRLPRRWSCCSPSPSAASCAA